MNAKQRRLTKVALIVFTLTVFFSRWHFKFPAVGDMEITSQELNFSDILMWFAMGIIYTGLFAVFGEPKTIPDKKPDEQKQPSSPTEKNN